jgi:hypothetical protein
MGLKMRRKRWGSLNTIQLDASLMFPVRQEKIISLLFQLETPPGRIARFELH